MKKNPQTSTLSADTEFYPIRTVSTLTGVNAITLRAWERRYGLIKPVRTDSGHRVYTRTDIDNIHRIVALLDKGVAISQVRHTLGEPERGAARADETGPWAGFRERMVIAITQFDENRLEDTYNEILALYPTDLVTRRVLVPLLVELGKRWQSTEGSVAEEHFFGVYLRNKLGARFHHRNRNNNGPKLLAACLPGEQHEVGLLLFALAAHEQGYRLVLLGADMPLAELPIAAKRSQSTAIVLSGSLEPDPQLFAEQLPALVAAAGIPVFIGGLTAVRRRDEIVTAGAVPLDNDIAHGLQRIAESLK
ncbi:MAG TPA: MerR family transcriptional regulator [Acidiferrobacterales bacterium]|nr:MerR family transcriptional regulator [Acidiferrobacterales bacterium]